MIVRTGLPRRTGRATGWVLAGVLALAGATACDAPFSEPSTRALQGGIAASLSASSLELTGAYTEAGQRWTVDLQVARPISEHVKVQSAGTNLEAIVIGDQAYFRGADFLAQHLGRDPASLNLVKAAGHAWWKGAASLVPQLPDLTDATRFTATFLGSNLDRRADHLTVAGVEAVDLSGPRADVYVAEAAPNQLLRVRLKAGVAVDGVTAGDLTYGAFGGTFDIAAPADVIDFSDLSTLPPQYTVVAVDTRACGTPCVVSAELKNLGGGRGAAAPSTVTFTMTDAATGALLGSCLAIVQPDVGYNATTAVSCTIGGLAGHAYNAATVTATPTNPGGA